MQKTKEIITNICLGITKGVGSIPAFVITVLALAFVFAMLVVQGFQKWNTGVGLFSNTFGSDVELITGIGSMVLLNSLHNKHQKHDKSIKQLHKKLDDLGKKK